MDDGWIGHGRILENIFVNRLVGRGKRTFAMPSTSFFFSLPLRPLNVPIIIQ